MGRKEKIGLVLIIVLSFSLPFLFIRNPLEISFLVLPLWIYWPITAGAWFYYGKNLWEVYLACWGTANIGIITLYFGTGLVQILLKKLFGNRNKKKLKFSLTEKFDSLKQRRIEKIINWLRKGTVPFILFMYFLPLPWFNSIPTIAMKLSGAKNGIWYLIGTNLFSTLLYVYLIQKGVNLFF